MTGSRLVIILVIDGALTLALSLAFRTGLIRQPASVGLIAAMVLPFAFLLTAALVSLAGTDGRDRLLLSEEPSPITETASPSDCKLGRSRLASPRRCRPMTELRGVFHLEPDSVRAADGHRLAVADGWVASNVERSEVLNQNVSVSGWAVGARSRRPVDAVLVFAGRRFVGAVRPTLRRPDVARTYGRAATASGFAVDLPLSVLREQRTEKPALQLLGISSTRASKLTFDCSTNRNSLGC